MAGMFDDLIPKKTGGMFDDLIPKKNDDGQFASGFKRSFEEVPGLVAGVGAYAADVVGADETRDKLLGYAKRKSEEVGQAHANDAQSITDAWDGKVGWLDFLANASGYVAGQAIQSILTGGVGAVGAKMLASQGAKQLAESAAAKAIASGAGEEAAKAAAASALSASLSKAMTRGAVAGAGAQNFGMELGSIYPEAVDQAEKEGRTLDVGDKFRVIAAASLAAGVDTAGEAIMAGRLLKGGTGATFKGRLAREVPTGMAREAGTEAVQTGIEQWGAAKPLDTREIIDAAGVGAVGGGLGGAVSARKAQQPNVATLPYSGPKAPDVGDILSAPDVDKAIQAAGDALKAKPKGLEIAEPVAQDGIPFEADPRFANLPTFDNGAAPKMPVFGSKQAADIHIGENDLLGRFEPIQVAPDQWSIKQTDADATAQSIKALTKWMQTAQAMPKAKADDMVLQAREQMGRDLVAVPHTNGQGYTVVPRGLVTADAVKAITPPSIPVGEASEAIPSPEATEVDPIPVGEASELVPTPEASELPKRIPVGKATEIEPETVLAQDITTPDGMPYGSKVAAVVRAKREGLSKDHVIEVPGAGWVIRPKLTVAQQPQATPIQAQPTNTRGTTAADVVKAQTPRTEAPAPTAATPAPAPVAGTGPASLEGGRLVEPTNSLARTASWVIREKATGNVVMETFDRKTVDALNTSKYEAVPIQEYLQGVARDAKQPANPTLTPGQPITVSGQDWTIDSADERGVTLLNASGTRRMVAKNSKTYAAVVDAARQPATQPVAPVAAKPKPAEPFQTPAERAADKVGDDFKPVTAADWSTEMARLRKVKPRPLDKLYGKAGPTPEQAEAHAKQTREWSSAYRRASLNQKKALAAENRARAEQDAQAPANAPKNPAEVNTSPERVQEAAESEQVAGPAAAEARPAQGADDALNKTLGDMLAEAGTQGVWLGRLNQTDGPSVEVKVIKWPSPNYGEFGFQWFYEGKPEKGIPFPRVKRSDTAKELADTLTNYLNADEDTPRFSMDQIGEKHGRLVGQRATLDQRKADAEMQAMRKWRGDTEARSWDAVDLASKQEFDRINAKRFKTANEERLLGIIKRRAEARPDKWKPGDGVGYRVTSDQINRGFQIESVNEADKTATIVQVADTGLTSSGGNNDRIGRQTIDVGDLVRERKYDRPAPAANPPAATPQAQQPATEPPANTDTLTDREKALRALAKTTADPGDVMLGNGRYVTLEQAVSAARAAVADGSLDPTAPFQFSRVLDIAPRDWDRMVSELAKPARADTAAQQPTKPAPAKSIAERHADAIKALSDAGIPARMARARGRQVVRAVNPAVSNSAVSIKATQGGPFVVFQDDDRAGGFRGQVLGIVNAEMSGGNVSADISDAAQAAAILDAAAEPPKGKERLDVLKDVKSGAITPDEVAAAYPAKDEADTAPAITRKQESALYDFLRQQTDGDFMRYELLAKKFQRAADGRATEEERRITSEWLAAMAEDGNEKQRAAAVGKAKAEADAAAGEVAAAERAAESLADLKAGKAGNERYRLYLSTLTQDERNAKTSVPDFNVGFMSFINARSGEYKAKQGARADNIIDQDAFTKYIREWVAQHGASATPTTPVAADAALWKRITAGEATPDEFKAGFEAWIANKEAIKADLSKLKKDELLKMMGGMSAQRYKSENKAEIVDAVWREGMSAYTLGRGYSYGMGSGSQERAVRNLVEATDAEQLAQYAKDQKAAEEESVARAAKVASAIKDPQTLEDFRLWMRATMSEGKTATEARLSLTPEQRIRYDNLQAETTRDRREASKAAERNRVDTASQTVGGQIVQTKHTRDGHDLWVVKLSERVGKDDYSTLLSGAKRLGGNYSSFRGNGAVPGFQFRTPEAAQAFLKLAAGDKAAAQEAVAQRRDAFEDDRSQSATERLNEMADRLDERADESLNRDRKANTERRARFAASAEAAANADKAMAQTMRNLANAISDGTAKFLDRVRQKTQVELLQGIVRTAQGDELRAKYPTYAEQQRHQGEPPSAETADFATFPTFTAYRSDLASLGRQLSDVDGTKAIGQRLLKVADDVSDAFMAFAREPGNLFRLSTFSVRAGDEARTAIFPTREGAERAIKRSGLTGKAIVFPEKRGVNRIIMSPSEAIARGLWTGDADKRITLSDEFGAELVEKIGKAARRGNKVSVPWQFEAVYDRRKTLARMGIETPAEFRAALREFIGLQERPAEPDKVKQMERAMIGRRNDGLDFFPTPEATADEMVAAADIQPGMRVLEPSAGWGHLAERIRAVGVEPDVVEFSNDRRELLEAKGFNVVGRDFLDVSEGGYDRILMNPPFSDGQDIQHVRHAYSLLKPGGRLVAIMGESAFTNQNKRATEFREWLESVGGTEEKLPEGTFLSSDLPVNTGANARMVVIDRSEVATNPSETTDSPASVFSRSTPGKGVDREDARAIVQAVRDSLPTSPPIHLHESVSQAPEGLREEIRRAGAQNDVEAAYHDGEIHVFYKNIADADRMAFVVGHHEVRHHGLRSMLGPRIGPVMLKMWQDNPALRKAAQAKMDEGLATSRVQAIEEALADMPVEQVEALTGWDKIVTAIRQWLRDLATRIRRTMPSLADALEPARWTDRDIAAMVRRAEDVSRGGSGRYQTGGTVFQRVWHGTPYRGIEKFDTDKIGTGEGAQAYGWGLYFASKREVADYYRRNLTDANGGAARMDYNGLVNGRRDTVDQVADAYQRLIDRDQAMLKKATDPEQRRRLEATIANTREKLRKIESQGQLYEVEIPEDDEMLLWDKPLSEQPAAVREALESLARSNPKTAEDFDIYRTAKPNTMGADAGFYYRGVAKALGSDKAASGALAALGIKGIKYLDGTSRGAGDGSYNYVVFDGSDTDIKATMFSRATTPKASLVEQKRFTAKAARNTVMDMLGDAGAKVSWWDKTLSTQYAKAQKFPAFKRVFDQVQQYLEDTSSFANQAADSAPSILPKMETWRDLKKFGLNAEDAKAVAGPIFTGTLTDEKVYSDGELRSKFGLNDRQIGQYREFLATVNTSLDQVVAAETVRLLADRNPGIAELAISDREALRTGADEFLTNQALAAGEDLNAEAEDRGEFTKLRDDIREKYARVDELKAKGYSPLMRFGKYAVNVEDKETGESLFFGLYESRAAANKMARELGEDPELSKHILTQGVLSAEQYKMYQAVPMESLEMFAQAIGAEQSEVFQEYIRLAKNNRSALKRLIKRKGTAGFSEDVPRVLAAFTTSNARLASGAMNWSAAKDAIQDIRDGDIKDEAIRLVDEVQNPGERAAMFRGLMFANFIGGSLASAAINLTQPLTMTLPYLSQWGGIGKASARLMAAGKMAASGKIDDTALKLALKKAENGGVVSPQEIHHLVAQSTGTWGSHPYLQKAAFIWGAPFSLAEQFNRRVSFIAAYQTAKEQGIEDAYGFAEKAVTETQGLYNRGNAPNWSRGAIGAAALTFKQFSIHYLEWMSRMWKSGPDGKKAVGIALALLVLAAGTDGLPGADDLDDLIDTLGQALGYDLNSKRARRDFVANTLGLGDATADVAARGLSAIAGVPMDVSLRMSMGNLIPATGILLRSTTDRSQSLMEVAGPVGGLAKQYLDAAQAGLRGDVAKAVETTLPVALQNVSKAIGMWQHGEARDSKGAKVMDADFTDGAMRFIGFNPSSIARESQKMSMIRRSEQLAKNVEGEIAAEWARGIADRDSDAVSEARKRLAQWNADNPNNRIKITTSQILMRVRKLRESRSQRFITSVSPERRSRVAEEMQ